MERLWNLGLRQNKETENEAVINTRIYLPHHGWVWLGCFFFGLLTKY
jgi:hypothetical protein